MRVQGPWHLTPDQLERCGIGAPWNPYQRSPRRRLYCVVRPPLERFASVLYHALHTFPVIRIWPTDRCGDPKRDIGSSPGDLRRAVHCFAAYAEELVARAQLQKARLRHRRGDGGGGQPRQTSPVESSSAQPRRLQVRSRRVTVFDRPGAGRAGSADQLVGRARQTAARRLGARLELTEALMHLQPQSSYACDMTFVMEDLRLMGMSDGKVSYPAKPAHVDPPNARSCI